MAIKITPEIDAALVSWVAADKAYQAFVRERGAHYRLRGDVKRQANALEFEARQEADAVMALLNPADHE